MSQEANKLCPSSTATEGALLLGLVQGDKSVALLQTPLPIDQAFIDKAKPLGSLEKRFRFANKCIKSGCKQWTGSRCGVIQTLAEINKNIVMENDLKPCLIRPRCRWFSEEGKSACTICTFVVTNNMEEEELVDIPRPGSM